MGRASTGKKVARAAGVGGGRTAGGRPPWAFYSAIVVIVLLGVVGTAVSKSSRDAHLSNSGGTGAPTVGQTSYAAYAVDICGTLQPNIPATHNPNGIATNGSGLIEMKPANKSSAGKNATLRLFATSVGMKLNGAELQMPKGKLYSNGDQCGGKQGHIYVRKFLSPTDSVGTPDKSDPAKIHLDQGAMYTIAFLPSGDKIPPPGPEVTAALTAATQAATGGAGPGAGGGSPTPGAGSPTPAPAPPSGPAPPQK